MFLLLFQCASPKQGADADEFDRTVIELIDEAGNSNDDLQRLDLLQTAQAQLGNADPLLADFERLMPVVEQWVHGKDLLWNTTEQDRPGEDGYLCVFFVLDTFPEDWGNVYPPAIESESPLYPIWAMFRGRMLIWTAIENNFLPDLYFSEGRQRLQDAADAYPDNDIVRAYLDQPVPWSAPTPPNFPKWAQAQNHALQKLTEIAEFWIENRQAPDGQFGGGWGDDVEMWRQWTPLLLGVQHPATQDSQTLLAENIFGLERMEDSYTSVLSDVEHSSEESGDPLTLMHLLQPDSEVWNTHSQIIADHWSDFWLQENNRGLKQFPSTYFTPTEISDNTNYACDTTYHTRAIQPLLHRWQLGDNGAQESITSWLDTWVDVTARESRGKPIGVLPSAIQFPEGEAGGPQGEWWDPGCHYSDVTYRFPRAFGLMSRALLLANHLTGDPTYLTPLESMAELRRRALDGSCEVDAEAGSECWVAHEIKGKLKDALGKGYLVGWRSFDDVLINDGHAYARYLLTGDMSIIEAALENTVEALSVNKAMYTSEVRFTDRIMKFHTNYYNEHAETPVPNVDETLMYNMLTGDVGDPSVLPLPGVYWEADPRQFVALVELNSTSGLIAQVGNTSQTPLRVTGKLLRLNGEPNVVLECESEIVLESPLLDNTVELELPPGSICEMRIESD